jgi:hypothetical protein
VQKVSPSLRGSRSHHQVQSAERSEMTLFSYECGARSPRPARPTGWPTAAERERRSPQVRSIRGSLCAFGGFGESIGRRGHRGRASKGTTSRLPKTRARRAAESDRVYLSYCVIENLSVTEHLEEPWAPMQNYIYDSIRERRVRQRSWRLRRGFLGPA